MAAAIVSALHLLALAIGLPSVFLRGRALGGRLDRDGIRRLLVADTMWGIAALLWVATGLLRAFAGLEKGTAFYLNSNLFWVKMALFVSVVLLEIRPAMTFMRWRADIRSGRTPNTASARLLYGLNHAEMIIVVAIVFVAAFMARGFGQR